MHLSVFGATGATGRLLVQQALDRGHHITALARNPAKLGIEHARLTVVGAELSNQDAIDEALRGSDAVLSLLGPRDKARDRPLTCGTERILAGMRRYGVRRCISGVSTAAARDPLDRVDVRLELLLGCIRFLFRDVYVDAMWAAELLRASALDWTLVRVPMLTNGPRTSSVNVGYLGHGVLGPRLSRANLADFMLRQLDDEDFVRRAPVVSDDVHGASA